jgi:RsiW-degrading membrane proteinase PrsW (M82 family)
MEFFIQLGFAITGGILPALIWLYYWLQEDKEHPEPNRLIIKTFIFGMLSAIAAIVIQKTTNRLVLQGVSVQLAFYSNYIPAMIALVIGATSEEVVKYLGAYFGGLKNKENNEPIDPIIYLITAALGFAALENTLYLINPIFSGDTTAALITGNLRFIGATLLHIAASAVIGIFISLSYYKNDYIKSRYLLTGFILSAALHSIFNSFIIRAGTFTLVGFATVWISIVLLILMFEKVKYKIKKY